MQASPSGLRLYRIAALAVMLACAPRCFAQYPIPRRNPEPPAGAGAGQPSSEGTPADKEKQPVAGPRALALLKIYDNGKAALIPIAIRAEGRFYDASVYKASPVPMALESGTVYEGYRSGVSQGIFTLSQPLEAQGSWSGVGKWATNDQLAASAKKAVPAKTSSDADTSGPPKLRRSSPPQEKATNAAPPATSSSSPAASASNPAGPPAEPEDPNRPMLKRGTVSEMAGTAKASSKEAPAAVPPAVVASKSDVSEPKAPELLPAISDVQPTESRSFLYPADAAQAQRFRTKMLALVTSELDKKFTSAPAQSPRSKNRSKTPASKIEPAYDDVQLHIFDLSNNNEPVAVLTATAKLPKPAAGAEPLPQSVMLVARDDIYDELHKVRLNITDAQHLDVIPRMDLIDVVDADGDHRGELLFKVTADAGTGYSIYRVIGDQLYPLFEGRPGE